MEILSALWESTLILAQMLFFGSRCERLCMIQFSLISLIPGLISNLQDCADPVFDSYAQNAEKPSSLKTSERSSRMPRQLYSNWNPTNIAH
jgi:hypothetical protein